MRALHRPGEALHSELHIRAGQRFAHEHWKGKDESCKSVLWSEVEPSGNRDVAFKLGSRGSAMFRRLLASSQNAQKTVNVFPV